MIGKYVQNQVKRIRNYTQIISFRGSKQKNPAVSSGILYLIVILLHEAALLFTDISIIQKNP